RQIGQATGLPNAPAAGEVSPDGTPGVHQQWVTGEQAAVYRLRGYLTKASTTVGTDSLSFGKMLGPELAVLPRRGRVDAVTGAACADVNAAVAERNAAELVAWDARKRTYGALPSAPESLFADPAQLKAFLENYLGTNSAWGRIGNDPDSIVC